MAINYMNYLKDNIDIWIVNRPKIEIGNDNQMIVKVLEKYGYMIKNYRHHKNGKPYIVGQNIKISISRSGEFFIFALSYQDEVGLDIEKKHKLSDIENFSNYIFIDKHVQDIIHGSCNDKFFTFLKYWTLYEAYAKFTGKGLVGVLNDKKTLEFDLDNIFSYTFIIKPDYVGTVICGRKKSINIIKLEFST